MAMTVEQILKLHDAGFSVEEITRFGAVMADAPAQEQEAPKPEETVQEQEAPKPETTAQDDTPAWFSKFITRYNSEMDDINKAIHAVNIRRAGADERGIETKTPEQLMAEAYANIR